MAQILNDFFISVFTKEDLNNIPVPPTRPSLNILTDMKFESETIKRKINQMKPSSVPGPDKISVRILQENCDSVANALAIIFNLSMQSGIVPIDWKHANVTPIFKKGVKGDPENYRPVLLTSIPCKLMEACMKDVIVEHLINNNLINNSQHGFMKHKSCTTNLLEFLEKVTLEMDTGNPMDIIYLDFAKAFDKVPKLRLLEKIKAFRAILSNGSNPG